MMQFTPGSPEYERMERALADKAAKLQVDTQLKKKEFLQRESKVYYEVYQEVSNAVREFAEMKGIDLVLRYNGAEMKPDDRASVLQGVNRAMVYQRNLDITREILDRLNRAPRGSAASDPRGVAQSGSPVRSSDSLSGRAADLVRGVCRESPNGHRRFLFWDTHHLARTATSTTDPRQVGPRGRLWFLERTRRHAGVSPCGDQHRDRIRSPRPPSRRFDSCLGTPPNRIASADHAITPRRPGRDGRARLGRAGRTANRQLRNLDRRGRNARHGRFQLAVCRGPAIRGKSSRRPRRAPTWSSVTSRASATTNVGSKPVPRVIRHVAAVPLGLRSRPRDRARDRSHRLTPSRFLRELAPARTFLTWEEAEWLRQQGLAQRVSPRDVLVFGEHGLIDNELRLESECAAHKVMDMVGRPVSGWLRFDWTVCRASQRTSAECRHGRSPLVGIPSD